MGGASIRHVQSGSNVTPSWEGGGNVFYGGLYLRVGSGALVKYLHINNIIRISYSGVPGTDNRFCVLSSFFYLVCKGAQTIQSPPIFMYIYIYPRFRRLQAGSCCPKCMYSIKIYKCERKKKQY